IPRDARSIASVRPTGPAPTTRTRGFTILLAALSLAALGRSCITDNHKKNHRGTWMFPSIWRALTGALVAALPLALSAIETANAYPDQPIKIIVAFPPGGSSDIVIRALQPAPSETLRQP